MKKERREIKKRESKINKEKMVGRTKEEKK